MSLYLRRTPRMGRGVFTKRPIARGQLIVANPYLILPNPTGLLGDYVFYLTPRDTGLALGFISMMNHSTTPNVRVTISARDVRAYALKPIARNRQLFIDYGYDPCNR